MFRIRGTMLWWPVLIVISYSQLVEGNSSPRGPICFNCSSQSTPDDCSTIALCKQGQVCMLQRRMDPVTHRQVYESKCEDEQECNSELSKFKQISLAFVGKRRKRDSLSVGGSCFMQCCNTTLCNNKCDNVSSSLIQTSTMPLTTPTTLIVKTSTTTQLDPCLSNPCQMGTCSLYGNTYMCTCEYGINGRNCDQVAISGHTATAAPSSGPACKDKLSTCGLLDASFYCIGSFYSWALENCQKTCNLCHDHAPTTLIPPATVNGEWLLFLKGVAGAPGPDLYQLWHSSQTINPNVPEAKTLTASFNGHYKPDYSNHWKDFCVDMVKVAIFDQGAEKANIIFNATGADKNSWFTPERIISSTWTDIKTAQKQVFSMAV